MQDFNRADPSDGTRLDVLTLAAFVFAAIFAGGNAVAVKLGLSELAPFWGAAIRFLIAAALTLGVVAAMRVEWPRGRALKGVLIYGVLNFGLFYTCLYWALQEVTAATAMVTLAIVPLITLILAVLQRIEAFHLRGLVGALMAAIGIGIVFGEKVGGVSLLSLAALLGGVLCAAEVGIVIKRFPRVHPAMENGIAMATGGLMLLVLSAIVREPWTFPSAPAVQFSFIYLVLLGSIGLFLLYLYVLDRWTASAAAYILLLAPLAAAILGLLVLGEPVSPALLIGGVLALAGVYVGAIAGHGRKATAKAEAGQ